MGSLWGEDFVIKESPKQTKKIIDKINNPKSNTIIVEKQLKKKSVSIQDKLKLIYSEVDRILGHYKENTLVIRDVQTLHEYISKSIENGVIAVDTETNNSLDPLTCLLMGPCLYTPGMKNAYIPMHHRDLVTGKELDNQITEEQFAEELRRLSNTKIIMHNGKFDYEVIKCTCGVELNIYWDTLIGSRILDENEKRAGLKYQYIDKIDSNQEKYDIEHLFEKQEYAIIDPDVFALYAATDSYMTYKLYEWQLNEFSKSENQRLYKLFMDIEMPIVTITAEMELTGVCLNIEYAKRLSNKYHKLVTEVDLQIEKELQKYKEKINQWRLTEEANYHPPKKTGQGESKSKSEQLSDPPEVTSPLQLAILLYDVLKVSQVDKKSPRGTGEDILKKIELPLCGLILKKRGLEKLINTYIDKLPECINSKDGKLHAGFNQLGAGTGRFSSNNPNLQNIPSHNNEIRMMFTASPGCVMIGSDFSQQEPRLLSHYSQDENMINAYKEGKDLYATIASRVYKNNYEDNLEFNPITKQMQPDGKKRRGSVKGLLLGIMYGMGEASIASTLKCSIDEAKDIKQGFFKEFPKVEKWINQTEKDAKINGYVEDIWGRRRRLPDLLREKYEISSKASTTDFNPLLGSLNLYSENNNTTKLITDYKNRLSKCKYRKEIEKVKTEALKQDIYIKDNSSFIAQAERQCVNARIQGGAASMSKRAMILVHHDELLKSLGFKLLIVVHDEIIGECPIENKEEVKKRLSELMVSSAKPEVEVPMKCDADDFPSWYYDVYSSEIKKEYKKFLEDNNEEVAFCKVAENHIESNVDTLKSIITL